jgi:hypothetical protein
MRKVQLNREAIAKRIKKSIIFGILLSLGGMFVYFTAAITGFVVYDYVGEKNIDDILSDIPKLIRFIFSLFIIGFILRLFFKINLRKTEKKCVICGEVFTNGKIENGCPKCGGKLEYLEGFFDRNPQYKN